MGLFPKTAQESTQQAEWAAGEGQDAGPDRELGSAFPGVPTHTRLRARPFSQKQGVSRPQDLSAGEGGLPGPARESVAHKLQLQAQDVDPGPRHNCTKGPPVQRGRPQASVSCGLRATVLKSSVGNVRRACFPRSLDG